MNTVRFVMALSAAVCCSIVFANAAGIEPNEQNALAAEDAITTALRHNDARALKHLLAADWIVVSADGGRAGRSDVLEAIEAGYFTRKMLVISNSRVRVYGDTAVVTSHAATSGLLMHKPFNDVQECQTDVLVWKSGSWVSELLHETRVIHQTNC
jgi:ketosteroid isomerase-like protein